jgi:hypothetical protein
MQDREAIAQGQPASAECPGPGAYNVAPTARGLAFSMPQAGVDAHEAPARAEASPGPGQYASPTAQPGPAYSIPAADRRGALLDGSASPGPGEYDAAHGTNSGPAYTMPKAAARDPAGSQNALPGPADYADAGKVVQHGPAFSLGARWREEKPLEDTSMLPGPQDYTLSPPEPGPAFTIGAKCHSGVVEVSPGPGAHSVAAGYAGPAYTIAGRRPSLPDARGVSPGPAAYTAPVRSRSVIRALQHCCCAASI